MRRYTVRVNETDHVMDVEELAADTFTVHLSDGRLVDVVLTDHQDLAQAVIAPQVEVGHARTPATAAGSVTVPGLGTGSGVGVGHGASTREAHAVPPPERARPARAATRTAAGARSVTAPMPGVILSVEVAPGATVQRGQTLMVLEAMKMKNDLKAQRDGTIAEVFVSAGDQVRHGDPLLEFQG